MGDVFNAHALLRELSLWLLGLALPAGGLAAGYHLVMLNLAIDEMQAAGHKRAVRTVIFGTVGALGVAAFLRFLSGFVPGASV